MIVCLTPPQMNDFGDLLGTPYAPVSKIAPVNAQPSRLKAFLVLFLQNGAAMCQRLVRAFTFYKRGHFNIK